MGARSPAWSQPRPRAQTPHRQPATPGRPARRRSRSRPAAGGPPSSSSPTATTALTASTSPLDTPPLPVDGQYASETDRSDSQVGYAACRALSRPTRAVRICSESPLGHSCSSRERAGRGGSSTSGTNSRSATGYPDRARAGLGFEVRPSICSASLAARDQQALQTVSDPRPALAVRVRVTRGWARAVRLPGTAPGAAAAWRRGGQLPITDDTMSCASFWIIFRCSGPEKLSA